MHRVAIFDQLSQTQVDLIQPLFEPFSCGLGTIIFEQGTPAEWLYLIVSGAVEMSFKPYDGHPFALSYVEKGGLFGWSAVVGKKELVRPCHSQESACPATMLDVGPAVLGDATDVKRVAALDELPFSIG